MQSPWEQEEQPLPQFQPPPWQMQTPPQFQTGFGPMDMYGGNEMNSQMQETGTQFDPASLAGFNPMSAVQGIGAGMDWQKYLKGAGIGSMAGGMVGGGSPESMVGGAVGGAAGSAAGTALATGGLAATPLAPIAPFLGSALGGAGGGLLGGLFGDDEEEKQQDEEKKRRRMYNQQEMGRTMASLGNWYSQNATNRHQALIDAFS